MPRLTIEDLKKIKDKAKQTMTIEVGRGARPRHGPHGHVRDLRWRPRGHGGPSQGDGGQRDNRRSCEYVGLRWVVQPGADGDR